MGVCVALFITEYAPQWLRRPAATWSICSQQSLDRLASGG
jgi:hypothetical protein